MLRSALGLLCALLSSFALAAGVGVDSDWLWLVVPLFLLAGYIWSGRDRN
ncbi:hypothetical protein [Streptomyces sp. NPDC127038]